VSAAPTDTMLRIATAAEMMIKMLNGD